MHAIICILEFMNFMLFLIKLIKLKQRIKFKKFELHNYGPTQVFVQLHLNRFGRFAVNGDRLECLIQQNGGHIEHNLEQFKCYLVFSVPSVL